jgi:hypothetical protein
MARREGSPGYCTPSLDPLECRFLLSSLHNSDAASRTAPTLAADVARQAAAAVNKSAIGIAHAVASAPHGESPDDDDQAEVSAASRGVYVGLRPITPDPNLLLLTFPNQAAAASVESSTGHLASLVASSEVPHFPPTISSAPTNPAGSGDDADRGLVVALNAPRAMFPAMASAASLGRIQLATPADSSPGDGESPASAPRRSDLLSDFLPFDRGSLEDAFDRFFEQLDDLDDGASGPDDASRAIRGPWLVAATVGALELGRRYWRRGRGEDEDDAGWGETPEEGEGADDDARFPGRPGSWPTRCL